MGEVEILHRLFTNAAEAGSRDAPRARIVPMDDRDAARFVTPDVITALDDLLRKTSPASTEPGWVVQRYVSANGQTFACVVVSYPDLVIAGSERNGVLNHARLVPVDGPSFDAAALVEMALELPTGGVRAAAAGDRLRVYLEELSGEPPVLVLPAAVAELQSLPPAVVTDVILGCLSTLRRRERVRIAIADAGPLTLARAWAALPVALQRSSAWGVGVGESCPVDVVFSTSGGTSATTTSSKALVDCVRQYVRLLHEAPERVSAMLEDPALSDANALAAMVRRSALAPELSSIDGSGRGEMSKKNKATKPEAPRREREPDRPEWQPIDPDIRSEMNRQFEAVEKSLRMVMDERLAAFEARQRTQPPLRQNSGTQASWWQRIWFPVTVALVAGALLFGGWKTMQWMTSKPDADAAVMHDVRPQYQPATQTARTNSDAETPRLSLAGDAVRRAETSGKWADEWKALLEREAVFSSDTIEGAAQRVEMTGDTRTALMRFAERVGRQEDLGSDGRQTLRGLLVECIAADIGRSSIDVDGNLADVKPLLNRVRERYRVRNTGNDPNQMALQSEIILRWMAEGER